MNKTFTLLALMCVATAVSGQRATMERARKGFDAERVAAQATVMPVQAKGLCVLSEDFESTPIGQLPAGWSTANVETQDDQTGAGTGNFVPAYIVSDFSSIDALPGSNYFNIPDQPAGNKFAGANDDGDPCNCDMINAVLVTPTMDFTGQTDMSVGFRAFCDDSFGGGDGAVEVSTDGGTTWAEIYAITPEEATWQNIVVDLSAYDNQPSVTLRFAWTDESSWAVGQAIDDVCVAPILANNLTLVRAWTANSTLSVADETVRSLEYSFLPLEQATALEFTARILNNGGQDQTDVIVTASVSFNGSPVGDFSSSPVPSITTGGSSVVTWSSSFVPSTPGLIGITYTLTAAATDENPTDNVLSKEFRVTGPAIADGSNAMGRDLDAATSFYGASDGNEYRVGNIFEIENSGSTAYGIGVCWGGGTEGTTVQGELLLGLDFSLIEMTEEYELTANDQNAAGDNTFAFLPFANPIQLTEDADVLAVAHHFGGDVVRVAASGVPEDTTAFLQDDAGTWSWLGATPMVRLFLGNSVGIQDPSSMGLTLGPNMPNPFNGFTSIPYTLERSQEVSLTIVDGTGRVVYQRELGTRPAGSQIVEFDGSTLAPGMYSYTLMAGQARLSRRMMVR